MKRTLLLFAALPIVLHAASAAAQDTATGQGTGVKGATTGSTDVTSEGKFQSAGKDADAKDATSLSLSAGYLSATGNSKLSAATLSEAFRVRREENQFTQKLAFNQAYAGKAGTDTQETVRNLQAHFRYDRFLGNMAAFFTTQFRHDKFQGLDLRSQVDPGLAYYFINQKTNLLWTEFGYDFQYDMRNKGFFEDARAAAIADGKDDPGLPDSTRTLHSTRLFLGYENDLSQTAKLTLGLEYLQGVAGSETTTKYASRINFDTALTAKVYKSLSMALSFGARLDTKAIEPVKKLDTLSGASLVYTFL